MRAARTVRAVALATVLSLSTSGIAECALAADLGRSVATMVDALEPDLAKPGPVATSREHDDLLDWLEARDGSGETSDAAMLTLVRAAGALAGAYQLEPGVERSAENPLGLTPDWSELARRQVTAIGVAITSELAGGEVLAAGVYWNTPVMERLRIVRVPAGVRVANLSELAAALGPSVSTCAVTVTDWVVLSEAMANELLATTDGLWMLAFGPANGPRRPTGWSTWIRDAQIPGALAFEHPVVHDADSYSAMFYGRGPSLAWTLRNAPRVRTTLGFGDFAAWIRGLLP